MFNILAQRICMLTFANQLQVQLKLWGMPLALQIFHHEPNSKFDLMVALAKNTYNHKISYVSSSGNGERLHQISFQSM